MKRNCQVVAFIRTADAHHEAAVASVKLIEREQGRLILTNFIISEVYILLLTRVSEKSH
jgi:predicted nucleic acid-binding protein